jgi:hypothetical protein
MSFQHEQHPSTKVHSDVNTAKAHSRTGVRNSRPDSRGCIAMGAPSAASKASGVKRCSVDGETALRAVKHRKRSPNNILSLEESMLRQPASSRGLGTSLASGPKGPQIKKAKVVPRGASDPRGPSAQSEIRARPPTEGRRRFLNGLRCRSGGWALKTHTLRICAAPFLLLNLSGVEETRRSR